MGERDPTAALRAALVRGRSPSTKDRKEMVALIEQGASLAPGPDWNPLVPAIGKLGSVAAAMLDAGADIAAPHRRGERPLHAAVWRFTLPILGRLIAMGAPLDATDARGRTALHEACRQGSSGGIRRLLDAGASLEVQDNRGKLPWDCLSRAAQMKQARRFSRAKPVLSGLDCDGRGAPAERCRSCAWTGTYARRCPWCRKRALWGPDREILHGNPMTPAADTEIAIHYGCAHCGLAWSALGWPESGVITLYGRGAADRLRWRSRDNGITWRLQT